MLDILKEVGLDTNQFLILLAVCGIALILVYGRFVIGALDPLNIFILGTCADCVLMYGLKWNTEDKIHFSFFIVCFTIGFYLARKIPRSHPSIHLRSDSLFELEMILVLTAFLLIAANLYLGMTVGFPLLSADPSVAKVTSFTGGLGTVRHLNQGPFVFLICGCTLLIAVGRRQALALALLLTSSFFVALSGSKGALLPILFVQGFVTFHKGFGVNNRFVQRIKRYSLPTLLAAACVAFAVVLRDTGGWATGAVFLGKRILYFGDVILFYYPNRGGIPQLAGANFISYLQYLLDPVLGMFRIKTYAAPLGSVIARDLDSGFGPNAQFFVRADIFFGPVFGCIYCAVIGFLCEFFRRQFYALRTSSAIALTASLMVAVSALNLAMESQLFVAEIVDTALVLLPLWCFARLASLSTGRLRELPKAAA
jgi:hypothetical protein